MDGILDKTKSFQIYELMDVVPARKSMVRRIAVLFNSDFEISCDPNIDDTVIIRGHDVNKEFIDFHFLFYRE